VNDDVTLSSGRIVQHHAPDADGSTVSVCDEATAGAMTEAEWSEYCIVIRQRARAKADATRAARKAASLAAFASR
jgi:hypothetical protein